MVKLKEDKQVGQNFIKLKHMAVVILLNYFKTKEMLKNCEAKWLEYKAVSLACLHDSRYLGRQGECSNPSPSKGSPKLSDVKRSSPNI